MLHKRASNCKGETSRSALEFTPKEKGRRNYLAFLYGNNDGFTSQLSCG
jgi:hypothetical protein